MGHTRTPQHALSPRLSLSTKPRKKRDSGLCAVVIASSLVHVPSHSLPALPRQPGEAAAHAQGQQGLELCCSLDWASPFSPRLLVFCRYVLLADALGCPVVVRNN